jgi:hypothetical protein
LSSWKDLSIVLENSLERFVTGFFDYVELKGFRMTNIVDLNLQGFKNLEGLV